VHVMTRSGYNALHFASTNKHAAAEQILLAAGISKQKPYFWGRAGSGGAHDLFI